MLNSIDELIVGRLYVLNKSGTGEWDGSIIRIDRIISSTVYITRVPDNEIGSTIIMNLMSWLTPVLISKTYGILYNL